MVRSSSELEYRLINYDCFDGAMNMALDEAILECFNKNESKAVLRFYGWKPDAVSIGYGQKLREENIDRIAQSGFDVVRRPTGGRAVLHKNELTYSFISHQDIVGKTIQAAYEKICSGLIEGFKQLNIEVSLGQSAGREYRDKQDCFLATTHADLQFDGKKLVGSAQLRRGEMVLQHGSILLNQPQALMPTLLGSAPDRSKNEQRHANLFEILDQTLTINKLEESFGKGFEKAFSCEFTVDQFSDQEMSFAQTNKERFQLKKSLIKD